MLRGLVYVELTLTGPSRDLHSGMYGGAVPNPLNVLTRILGQLHDDEGRVQIPGFYDDVRELEEARRGRALPFDEAEFLAGAGLATPSGRGRALDARAGLVAADLRPQRHLGRLHRRRAPRP